MQFTREKTLFIYSKRFRFEIGSQEEIIDLSYIILGPIPTISYQLLTIANDASQ